MLKIMGKKYLQFYAEIFCLSKPVSCVFLFVDGGRNSILYIAMAGTHQIWVYFLQDSTWYQNKFVLL